MVNGHPSPVSEAEFLASLRHTRKKVIGFYVGLFVMLGAGLWLSLGVGSAVGLVCGVAVAICLFLGLFFAVGDMADMDEETLVSLYAILRHDPARFAGQLGHYMDFWHWLDCRFWRLRILWRVWRRFAG